MEELIVKAKDEYLDTVISFVEGQLESWECSMKVMTQVNVAVEEVFVNISHYAYVPGEGDVTIRLEFDEKERGLTITFIDSGMPFDPLAKPDPDITLSAEERKIGGLGIYMVKKSMDDVYYEYTDGKNILKLTKKI